MNWKAWSQVSGGLAKPGSLVTVVRRDVLFLTNSEGGIVTTILGSGRWASVSEGRSTPGAPVTAMLWGPYRIALFIADPSGGYFTQVTYPRLHCYDPGDLVAGMTMEVLEVDARLGNSRGETPPTMAALARNERFYKLSTFSDVKLPQTYWCSVRYGPWLAMATERESCVDGEPNFWELFIVEVARRRAGNSALRA